MSIISQNATTGALSLASQDEIATIDTGKLGNVVEDSSPQLGGNLDVNGQQLVTVSNGNIVLAPNGSGQTSITGGSTNAAPLNISYADDGAAAGPQVVLNRTSTSPAADDLLGSIIFKGKDSAGNTDTYGSITGRIGRTNSGSERGLINFNVIDNGSDENVMSLSRKGLFFGAGNVVALGGDSANFFTSLYVTDPTANRTITFPDATGTAVLTDTTDTLTNKTLTNPVISQVVSVSNGNIQLDPNGTGKIILDATTNVNGVRTQANTLFISTDMSSLLTDDLHNSIQCNLDFTGTTIGSGTRQNSITFGVTDDTVGDEQAGRFSCEFTSVDTTSNKMKLIAIDNSTSGAVNGQIDVSPKKGTINVPFELPTYAVGSLPTTGIGAGAIAYATGLNSSDVSTGKAMVFYDGSNWKYMHIPQTTARS